jgi:hypothetical protein
MTTVISCPTCGLKASKTSQRLSAATVTRTVQVAHLDMERLCQNLQRGDDGKLSCPILNEAIELSGGESSGG